MKIKYQLLLTIVSFAIVLLIISLSFFYTDERSNQLSAEQDKTVNIGSIVGNLNSITDDYLLFQNNASLLNWHSDIAAIYGNLSALDMNDQQQGPIIHIIGLDTQEVDNAFNQTAFYLQTAPRNQSVRILPEFQIVWSNLSHNLQTLSNDSAQLSQVILDQRDAAKQSNVILIFILLSVFAFYLVLSYVINYRNTLKSLYRLQAGINIVGSGNLDYSVNVPQKNEIRDLSNSFNQMTVNLKSVTDKLQQQEHLAAIGQMARMVGHDIRNPLQAITSDMYLIESDVALLPETERKNSLQESITSIKGNLIYIGKIVDDLQDYAKSQIPHLERIVIDKVIGEVMPLVPVSPKHEISIQIDEDFPPIKADFSMMQRVLSNLVINALQAMPDGGRLTIHAFYKNSKAFIAVQDTGVGIPDKIRDRLFEPMITTKAKGQGLGLVVVKRLVEAQGGMITFESKEGKGTKFIIELSLNK